jgi:predicted helicase
MSQLLIQHYLNDLDLIKQISGSNRETVVREAFKDLLKNWGKQQGLIFIAEYPKKTATQTNIAVDGALVDGMRIPLGYWEAKDEKDDLEKEIEKKFKKGYPQDNIIFTDDVTAVLIQHKEEVLRCKMTDTVTLAQLIKLFFGFERPEIASFRAAVTQFKFDLPAVLESIRKMIEEALQVKPVFQEAANQFLKHVQEAINPKLIEADVCEMLIQHILTNEVFSAIFPGTNYHEDNSVARELHKLEATFFTGNTKFQALKGLEPYYGAIRQAAALIETHHEKQTFLKVIYENFYKVYNPKAADRLGVVYTPNEIVRFMIDAADWLCEKHFKRNLIDKNVQILDPAAGTGTFICELLEHFRGQKEKLKYKYLNELHANEVAILPYYIANLNIEATYAAIMKEYVSFPSLCFVDTLDNTYALRKYRGHMDDLFGSMSDDNIKRIQRQNSRQISVVLGNPPYRANQKNENENNKNREYLEIDKRIKQTYIAESNAQKTKAYDMLMRFYRWATDRIDLDGIVAFITNRSFIDKSTHDGFRKTIEKEFSDVYIVDLGGEMLEGDSKGNVFGITVGVAIAFLVRRKNNKVPAKINYFAIRQCDAQERLSYLTKTPIADIEFETIKPDQKNNWIKFGDIDYPGLLPLISKTAKLDKKKDTTKAIFKMFSLGVVTARDEWVYGFCTTSAAAKVSHLINVYNAERNKVGGKKLSPEIVNGLDPSIKWTRAIKADLVKNRAFAFDNKCLVNALYRPFVKRILYFNGKLNEMRYQLPHIYGEKAEHQLPSITFTDSGSQKPFMALACASVFDYHLAGAAAASVSIPFQCVQAGETVDNVTNWGYEQFNKHYQPGRGRKARLITKAAIFHYVYAVLHDPIYRDKYERNLKRESPRIPFYSDFWQWADWGQTLMELHINYGSVESFKLTRTDTPDDSAKKAGRSLKTILKADKNANAIIIDSETTLNGVLGGIGLVIVAP